MEKVGIRELKNNLSKYLKCVKRGESLIITERHHSIALLEPIKSTSLKEVYAMIEKGIASWKGGKPCGSSYPIKIKGKKTIADRVSEDRR